MEVAESYLAELFHKSMVQVKIEEQEYDNSPLRKFKSCRLHDLMRDLALSKAKEEGFFKVVNIQESCDFHCDLSVELLSSCTKQLVVYFPKLRYTGIKTDHSVVKVNGVHLRSIFLLREYGYHLPFLTYRIKTANFKLLRVFVLEGFDVRVGASSLDVVVSSLVYLRYLSVRTDSLICPSVQKLELLQTLKLDDPLGFERFPRWTAAELRNMGRLQHLVLPSINTSETSLKRKLRFDRLSKLETVENFDSSWCEVKDLPKLVKLQKLTVIVENSKEDLTEILKYLQDIASTSSYTCLRYMSLTIRKCHLSKQSDASEILRMLFCDPGLHLRELVLKGSILKLGQLVDPSLYHITSLKLYESEVEQDIMPVLERIPVLRTLLGHVWYEIWKRNGMEMNKKGKEN